MKKATIYTGTGDNGTTSLCGGTRVAKDHPRVEAYGTLDELNAHLGLLAASLDNAATIGFIEEIENSIFNIGCHLANENCQDSPVDESGIERLEKEIEFLITEKGVKIPELSTISIQQSGLIGEQFLEITPPKTKNIYSGTDFSTAGTKIITVIYTKNEIILVYSHNL